MARLPVDESQVMPQVGGVAPGRDYMPNVHLDTGLAAQFAHLSQEGQQLVTSAGQVEAQQAQLKQRIDMLNLHTEATKAFKNYEVEQMQNGDPWTKPGVHMDNLQQIQDQLLTEVPQELQPLAKATLGEIGARTYGTVMGHSVEMQRNDAHGALQRNIDETARRIPTLDPSAQKQEMADLQAKLDPKGPFASLGNQALTQMWLQAQTKIGEAVADNVVQNPGRLGLTPTTLYDRAQNFNDPLYNGLTDAQKFQVASKAHQMWRNYQNTNESNLANSAIGWLTSSADKDVQFGQTLMANATRMMQNRDISSTAGEKWIAVANAAINGTGKGDGGQTAASVHADIMTKGLSPQQIIDGWKENRFPGMTPQQFIQQVDFSQQFNTKEKKTMDQEEAHRLGLYRELFKGNKSIETAFLSDWMRDRQDGAKSQWDHDPAKLDDALKKTAQRYMTTVVNKSAMISTNIDRQNNLIANPPPKKQGFMADLPWMKPKGQ